MGDRGIVVQFLVGEVVVSLLRSFQTGSGVNPPTFSACTGGTLYPVTRRPERIADHSAEVKNGLRYTSTTQYTVTKWTGTLVNLAQDLRFGLVRLF